MDQTYTDGERLMGGWQETFRTDDATFRVRKELYKTVKHDGILLEKLTDSGWEILEKKDLRDFYDEENKKTQMAWAYRQWDKYYRNGDIEECSYNAPVRITTDIEQLKESLRDTTVKGFSLVDTFDAWRWNRPENEDVTILGTPGHGESQYGVPYAIDVNGEQYPLHERRIRGELTVEKYVDGLRKAIVKAKEKDLL